MRTVLIYMALVVLTGCGAGLEEPDTRPVLAADCPIVANQPEPVCKVAQ